jgi:hypothetical protein
MTASRTIECLLLAMLAACTQKVTGGEVAEGDPAGGEPVLAPPGDPPVVEPPPSDPGDPGVHQCLTVLEGQGIVRVTLETGAVETVAPAPSSLATLSPSHVLITEDAIYQCNMDTLLLTRVDLATDTAETAGVNCDGVTAHAGGLLVVPFFGDAGGPDAPLSFYASWDDALAGNATIVDVEYTQALNILTRGDTLYTAWHSTHELGRTDLVTGAALPRLGLQNYDTWILGMAITSDGLLVLDASWPEQRLAVFDAETGAALYDVPLDGFSSGLSCR